MEELIRLSTVTVEEDGNTFVADLTIETSELKRHLAKAGYKIVKK